MKQSPLQTKGTNDSFFVWSEIYPRYMKNKNN